MIGPTNGSTSFSRIARWLDVDVECEIEGEIAIQRLIPYICMKCKQDLDEASDYQTGY